MSRVRVVAALCAVFFVGVAVVCMPQASFGDSPPLPASFPAPSWTDTVGPIALSSPAITTMDGVQAIVFGTESGYVYAVNAATGANLPGWPVAVDIAPGVPTAIESSPTVAYLDGPTQPPTIIVGAGSTYVAHQQGGLLAFRADGTLRFRFLTTDVFGEWQGGATPDGYDEAVFSTPAIGDLTGNGSVDIVFGSWDHRVYTLNASGQVLKGFPFDTQDTIWSSPALFHVRGGARKMDIFIGGDASGRNNCHGGFVYDLSYLRHVPTVMWQHCEAQTIWSSPAVGVINATQRPVVVVGTGFGIRPPYSPGASRLYAFYAKNGRKVKGWPVDTAGPTYGSPAIGVIGASSTPAVVDTSWCLACATSEPGTTATTGDSMVYAWSGSGHVLWSAELPGPNDFSSPALVDLTGSGSNDVLVGSAGGLYPISGLDGSFLFGTSGTAPINFCSVQTTPAIADVPGDGSGSGWHLFETCGGPTQIIGTGRLISYPLPVTPATAPAWPMWRENPTHDGVAASTLHPTTTSAP